MAEYNFNDDIILGEEGEQIVVKDLESMGGKFISDNKNNRYDLLMDMPIRGCLSAVVYENKTYEVKTDVFCKPHQDTGNMFIEYECRGKESGLRVTEAEWFVMYFKHFDELWYIKSNDLKDLLMCNVFPKTEFSGDDGSNTKGYLIPRYQFKHKFKVRIVPKKWLS